MRSIESGSAPTEASIRSAEEENEAEGGAQALQAAIDALRGAWCVSPGGSNAASERLRNDRPPWQQQQQQQQQQHTREHAAVLAETATVEGIKGRAGQVEPTGVREDGKDADEDVNEADGQQEAEGWGDGEGDDYSEDEFDDTEIDQQEHGNATPEKGSGNDQTPGVEVPAEAGTMQGTCEQRTGGSTSAELDTAVQNEDGGQGTGDGAGRPDRQGVEPGHTQDNDTFAAGNDSTNSGKGGYTISEVPVYLSGGKTVRARFPSGSVSEPLT